MSNAVCRNFNYNESPDGILASLSLNCDKCKFNGDCVIETAYPKAKDYAASMEFVEMKGDENADSN